MKDDLTIVIIAKDVAETIENTFKSVRGLGQILVIDNQSTDNTTKITEKYTDKVIETDLESFADIRNLALKEVTTDWILYIDADEVVSNGLKREITKLLDNNDIGVYELIRWNYFLGKRMYDDVVGRLFHKSLIKGWRGKIHESPMVNESFKQLKSPLFHHTHRDITSMLEKTNQWSEMEADLRMNANHPPVKWWRLLRVALTIWWQQLFEKKIWKYGREGWFEGYFQVVDKLIVYTKLWERQQKI